MRIYSNSSSKKGSDPTTGKYSSSFMMKKGLDMKKARSLDPSMVKKSSNFLLIDSQDKEEREECPSAATTAMIYGTKTTLSKKGSKDYSEDLKCLLNEIDSKLEMRYTIGEYVNYQFNLQKAKDEV